MESSDEKDKRGREMFKRAGICLLDVQAIEKYLVLLLWPSRVAQLKPLSVPDFNQLYDDLWSMNMGRLQGLFQGRFKDDLLLEQFRKVKKERDYFIHLFFIDAALRGPISQATVDEIDRLISKLNELHTLFITFASRLERLIPAEQIIFDRQLPRLYQKAVRAKQKGTKSADQ
jgi:uncharacterized protein YdiU (UPF0061 family)